MSTRPIDILLVDDAPSDVELTRIYFDKAKMLNKLFAVGDGNTAIDFLERNAPYQGVPTPGLILLDLNLPGNSGMEVLQWIRANPATKSIPVVILTGSTAENDAALAYELGADLFVTKPLDIEGVRRIAMAIDGVWLALVSET